MKDIRPTDCQWLNGNIGKCSSQLRHWGDSQIPYIAIKKNFYRKWLESPYKVKYKLWGHYAKTISKITSTDLDLTTCRSYMKNYLNQSKNQHIPVLDELFVVLIFQ